MRLDSLTPNAHYDLVHGLPKTLEKDNDGSYLFRFNIEEEYVEDESGEKVKVGWKCCEVRTFSEPTKANLKRVIIRWVLDETAEFALVNSYNKYVLGLITDESVVSEYKEYLQFTEDLDAMLLRVL